MYIHKKVKLLIKNNNEPEMNTETKTGENIKNKEI